MPGLGITYGRGGATTNLQDLQNSDCIIIEGSNMAEAHPVGFRHPMIAKEKGAKLIHVDPRFTRTSAMCDIYAPIRPGTDIAFLGGLINYVLQNEEYFEEYVKVYTNAATIITEDFEEADASGLFSGWDEESKQYDPSSWRYEGHPIDYASVGGSQERIVGEAGEGEGGEMHPGMPRPTDMSLEHPRCVFQILKRHFARYTPEMVEKVCGTPKEAFLEVAKDPGRELGAGEDLGALLRGRLDAAFQGRADHPHGGDPTAPPRQHRASGRRHHGAARARDHSGLDRHRHPLRHPPWLSADAGREQGPRHVEELPRERDCRERLVVQLPQVHNQPDEGLVRREVRPRERRSLRPFPAHLRRSLLLPHHNGHERRQREGLLRLRAELRGRGAPRQDGPRRPEEPRLARGPRRLRGRDREAWKLDGANPEECGTEVFFIPSALVAEKDGSFTQTQRLLQWHDKAVEPPGDARSDAWFVYHLGRRIKELYKGSRKRRDRLVKALTWDYPTEGERGEPHIESILKEVSGYTVADGEPVGGFAELQDDGSTACGGWIYSGVYAGGVNHARDRRPGDNPNLEWGWAWPMNRRILYNRASADPEGRPWSERKKYIWWDEKEEKWVGDDVVDFEATKPPSYRPDEDARGVDALPGDGPFIMNGDGKGWLFAPVGLEDGPLPVHYEPVESPVPNLLYDNVQYNPAVRTFDRPDNPYNPPEDPRYPYVVTTYRLTEHHTSGAMSRWIPWLSELQPELFCEISPELAAEKGVNNTGWVTISTSRGKIHCKALVTDRIPVYDFQGEKLHTIGLPYHWGPNGLVKGDVVNDLIPVALEANVAIHEAKAFTANLEAGKV